jgi:ComF family protein
LYANDPPGVTPPALPRWRDRLLHALLPAPCLGCEQPLPATGTALGLCSSCRGRLRPLPDIPAAPPALDRLLALWSYEAPLDAVIQALKFRRLDYLGRHLGEEMASRWREALAGADLVAPVPLHWRRRLARGYNQAERIACTLAGRLGLPLEPLLVRRRGTPPQTSLGREERKANLRRAFGLRRGWSPAADRIRGRRIVLVDDVTTTGATLEAAATVLRENGAAAVIAVVAGRTPREVSPSGARP